MAEESNFIIQEQNLLRLILSDTHYTTIVDPKYLVTDSAKGILNGITDCLKDNQELSIRNVTSKSNSYIDISLSQVEYLFNIVKPNDSFEALYKTVQKEWAKQSLRSTVFENVLSEVSSKTTFDIEVFKSLQNEINERINLLSDESSKIHTLDTMLDSYSEELHRRSTGASFYDTGCSHLNKHLIEGFAPQKITTLFGPSGVGKSTYSLYLVNKHINKQIPCIYFSPEMPLISTMDRLVAQRNNIPITELYPSVNSDGSTQIQDYVFQILEKEKERLKNKKKFLFIEEESISLQYIEQVVSQFMATEKVEYATIFIDLLTMVKEFNQGNKSKADKYEDAMNSLHEMSRRLNIHIVGVVQGKRPQNKVSISNIEDLDKLRPGPEDIKNSGAILERSRVVISTFRPKFFASIYLPDDIETEIMEDVMVISILKQNMGKLSTLKYLFNGQKSSLVKIQELPPDTIAQQD